ncbi:MAG: DUF1294 domain-containing protein [Oleispira sp.]|nr:DUF1294 domain-containing protein [Oleispira sp.]
MIAILFLLVLFAITAIGWLPFALAVSYFLLSAFTFFLYGLDKLLALKEQRRISEKTLHLLALTGGWPGAYVGQQIFRHKVSKKIFRRRFSMTVLVNIAVLVSFLSTRIELPRF